MMLVEPDVLAEERGLHLFSATELSDFGGGGYPSAVNSGTDKELLREYAEQRSETAFDELVRRHVDLVHSAALRNTTEILLAAPDTNRYP